VSWRVCFHSALDIYSLAASLFNLITEVGLSKAQAAGLVQGAQVGGQLGGQAMGTAIPTSGPPLALSKLFQPAQRPLLVGWVSGPWSLCSFYSWVLGSKSQCTPHHLLHLVFLSKSLQVLHLPKPPNACLPARGHFTWQQGNSIRHSHFSKWEQKYHL
jgi:hypothetical protein